MPPKKHKLSREELLQKKRDAERLRYQLRKNNPQKREEMKEKERLKYLKKKEKGQVKLVKDMTPREHRATLKKWKKNCTVYRAKKKQFNSITRNFLHENTPPSDAERLTLVSRSSTPVSVSILNSDVPGHSVVSSPSAAVTKSSIIRSREARNDRRRMNKEKDRTIAKLKKRLGKYRKRLARLEDKNNKKVDDTPNTKMQKMMKRPDGREEVVKKALFGDVLNLQLKENYSRLNKIEDKRIFAKVVSGPVIQKYKKRLPKDTAAVIYKVNEKFNTYNSLSVPQLRRKSLTKRVDMIIQQFYEDDSNSRMGAGKKEFITRNKERKQKRYLLDTMRNLYTKFLANNFKISYQSFCRLRPFWVVKPNNQNRDTCLCIVHSNMGMKLSALYSAKILPYNNYQKLLEELCCDRYNLKCLSRSCKFCVNKTPKYKEFNNSKVIKYQIWLAERQQIIDIKTKKPRLVTKYLKKTMHIYPRQLIIKLHEDLDKFIAHERNITHQFNAIKTLKKNLQSDEVLIHMDFSENYSTKYGEEIQAFHFGGSRAQLSLHTVVVYLQGKTESYCTVSDNISHSPGAIWAHLLPIFRALPNGIRRVHFLSDGPVTQYRNKTMFFIMATKLTEEIPDIDAFTWNYTESGHGKGAPDGIGATCKRTADFVVNAGYDINNIDVFIQCIQNRCPKITCLKIDSDIIQNLIHDIDKEASKQKSFKGTLDVHQVSGVFPKTILGSTFCKTLNMRRLSCFCNDYTCEHYKMGNITYDLTHRWNVEDVFSESDDDIPLASVAINIQNKSSAEPGPSGLQKVILYNTGDYILVRFLAKNLEYRYVAVINAIDEEENDLQVTFLKICNDQVQSFRIDDSDISNISFEQIVRKLENPNIILKGKRIFYKFPYIVDVFER